MVQLLLDKRLLLLRIKLPGGRGTPANRRNLILRQCTSGATATYTDALNVLCWLRARFFVHPVCLCKQKVSMHEKPLLLSTARTTHPRELWQSIPVASPTDRRTALVARGT